MLTFKKKNLKTKQKLYYIIKIILLNIKKNKNFII
jgi:hypothetical protein